MLHPCQVLVKPRLDISGDIYQGALGAFVVISMSHTDVLAAVNGAHGLNMDVGGPSFVEETRL